MGVGEIIAGLLSGYLLSKFKDTKIFLFANIMVAIFDTAFYLVPNGLPQYMCLLLTICGVATQFNTIYVLVELRVPPENTGSALVIVLTFGAMASAVAPLIS